MAGPAVPRRPAGVVLLGGTHSSLALARSIRESGVPIWLVTEDSALLRLSRSVDHILVWKGAGDPGAVSFLRDAADRHGLKGHLLVACGDAEVHLVSQQHAALSEDFTLFITPWERLRWACEKTLAYERAAGIGLACPRSYRATSPAEAKALDPAFPVVLKPSTRVASNPFTRAKAWRIDRADEFLPAYERAAGYVGAGNVVIQELVPGGGETQMSYAALWNEGNPAGELTARRMRQFPVDFGFTSTFVEVADLPDVLEAGRRFAKSIGHHGLIEVEFKRDARTGELKLLDANPRPWSWFALADACGVPLGRMMWAIARGEAPPEATGPRSGVRWMFLPRDVATATIMMIRGLLSPGAYLKSFENVRAWALFHPRDPLPALFDIPLTAARVLTRRILPMLRAGSGNR